MLRSLSKLNLRSTSVAETVADENDESETALTISDDYVSWPPPLDEAKEVCVTTKEEDDVLARKGYVIKHKVGEGSYGKVSEAYSTKMKLSVAVKVVDLANAPEEFKTKFFPRELLFMSHIDHPNIVKMYEYFEAGTKTLLILEFAQNGDLTGFVHLGQHLSEPHSKHLFRQLCEAVGYLHTNRVVHRDLKTDNILLDKFNNIKLADFGFASCLLPGEVSKTFLHSVSYAAPEILQGEPFKGFYYDIWSMGVILFVMVTGLEPFDNSNMDRLEEAQLERKIDYPKNQRFSKEFLTLIEGILEPNYKIRFEMYDILKSVWLRDTPYFMAKSAEDAKQLKQKFEEEEAALLNSFKAIDETTERQKVLPGVTVAGMSIPMNEP